VSTERRIGSRHASWWLSSATTSTTVVVIPLVIASPGRPGATQLLISDGLIRLLARVAC
jgi:hypothetical protein